MLPAGAAGNVVGPWATRARAALASAGAVVSASPPALAWGAGAAAGGGSTRPAAIHVRGSVLFQRTVEADSPLHFDDFASADRDGDHDITLDELNGVSLNEDDDYGTLAERLYLGLVPAVPRFRDTDACSAMPPEDDF